MTRLPSTVRLIAAAAAAAALTVLAGCGGGGPGTATSATYTVAIERVTFPARQRVAQRSTFVLRLRNAGEQTIPNLVVTLRGFTGGTGAARDLWVVDEPPVGAVTAIDDTWAAGPLAPRATATLRWTVTAVVAGTHELSYAVAPDLARASARLADGDEARGMLAVRVIDRPAQARVDPRTGAVIRE